MTTQTIEIELPFSLLEQAQVYAVDDVYALVTSLLVEYIQSKNRRERFQAYEAYYSSRSQEDVKEELDLLNDFSYSDADIDSDSNDWNV